MTASLKELNNQLEKQRWKIGWNKRKGDLPSKVDGFLRGDGINKGNEVSKITWAKFSEWRALALKINDDEIGENEEGSEIYIGWKVHGRRSDTLV